MSLIADSFPPENRGRPVGVYSMALSLGAGTASLIGAGVLAWAKTSDGVVLPWIGAAKPWQLAFFAVGLPGLLLAFACVWQREPARPQAFAPEKSDFSAMLNHVFARWRAFFGLILLICVMTIIAYSHGFLPSAFARHYHWQVQDYAFANGIMTLALGPVTVASVGVLCDKWRGSGRDDAPFMLLTFGFVGLILAASTALLMPYAWLALVMLGVTTMALAVVTASGILCLLDITPAAIRGQVVALYYMCISIAGLMLGPVSVGKLSTRLFGEAQLHLAVAAVPLIYGLLPLMLLPAIRRHYLAQKQAVIGENL
jgi:MFS family permease